VSRVLIPEDDFVYIILPVTDLDEALVEELTTSRDLAVVRKDMRGVMAAVKVAKPIPKKLQKYEALHPVQMRSIARSKEWHANPAKFNPKLSDRDKKPGKEEKPKDDPKDTKEDPPKGTKKKATKKSTKKSR
jgi:hypothetical protein